MAHGWKALATVILSLNPPGLHADHSLAVEIRAQALEARQSLRIESMADVERRAARYFAANGGLLNELYRLRTELIAEVFLVPEPEIEKR